MGVLVKSALPKGKRAKSAANLGFRVSGLGFRALGINFCCLNSPFVPDPQAALAEAVLRQGVPIFRV